jgi:hypothetical protein
MAELTLEQRVALLEHSVAELRGAASGVSAQQEASNGPEGTLEQRVSALEEVVSALKQSGPETQAKWWERPPLTADLLQAHEAMTAYGQYFRRTGRMPPDDWRPNDPIPDPPEWAA